MLREQLRERAPLRRAAAARSRRAGRGPVGLGVELVALEDDELRVDALPPQRLHVLPRHARGVDGAVDDRAAAASRGRIECAEPLLDGRRATRRARPSASRRARPRGRRPRRPPRRARRGARCSRAPRPGARPARRRRPRRRSPPPRAPARTRGAADPGRGAAGDACLRRAWQQHAAPSYRRGRAARSHSLHVVPAQHQGDPTRPGRSSAAPRARPDAARAARRAPPSEISPSACLTPRYGRFRSSW